MPWQLRIELCRLLTASVCLTLSISADQLEQTVTVETPHRFGDGGPKLNVQAVLGFPPSKQFFDNYVLPSVPVKMREAAKLSLAFTLWDDKYFLQLDIPQDQDEVIVETMKKENRTQETLHLSFHEFVHSYNDTSRYMVNPVPSFLRYVSTAS